MRCAGRASQEIESLRAAVDTSKQAAREWGEREAAYQQQLASLKAALKGLSEERQGAMDRLQGAEEDREGAFSRLGERAGQGGACRWD